MGLGSAGATERGERARTREFFFFALSAQREKRSKETSHLEACLLFCVRKGLRG